jgi:hypothetical protein
MKNVVTKRYETKVELCMESVHGNNVQLDSEQKKIKTMLKWLEVFQKVDLVLAPYLHVLIIPEW